MSLTTDTILFFFNDTATTEIYTLSLHDALPISPLSNPGTQPDPYAAAPSRGTGRAHPAAAVGMARRASRGVERSEEHTSELQSQSNLVCRLLLEKKKHADRPQDLDHAISSTAQL